MGETRPENLKQMIRDTLLLVCRQGIECEVRFAVHAVIGVTVDDDQSFYLHIDENVDRDGAPQTESSGVGRRTRGAAAATRKRYSRGSSEGSSTPKKILLSEWVNSKQSRGGGDGSQPMQWSVVNVKTERKDEDDEVEEDVVEEDEPESTSTRGTLTYTSGGGESGSGVIQSQLHRFTCVPLDKTPSDDKRQDGSLGTLKYEIRHRQYRESSEDPVTGSSQLDASSISREEEKRQRKNAASRRYRARLKQNKQKWEEYLKRERESSRKRRQRKQREDSVPVYMEDDGTGYSIEQKQGSTADPEEMDGSIEQDIGEGEGSDGEVRASEEGGSEGEQTGTSLSMADMGNYSSEALLEEL